MLARRHAAVPAAVFETIPVSIRAAHGAVVEDVDGNRLIDLASGVSVLNAGNTPVGVVTAIQAQAELYTHTCFQILTNEPYVRLAEEMNELVPGRAEKRTIFVNSGAEAVENAVKIARSYSGRSGVVAFEHAFHGRTYMAMALTGKASPYKRAFGPLPGDVYRIPYSYPYRSPCNDDLARCGVRCAERAISHLRSHVGVDAIACLVVEPVAGEGGVIVPGNGFLAALRQFCDENRILLVADEIQTGLGRTGAWWGFEHAAVIPDLVVTAKTLGGGLPLGAVTGPADVMDAVHVGGLGGTFGGNPLACAAGSEVIRIIREEGLIDRARAIESTVMPRLRQMQEVTDHVGDVRGLGAMIAIELVEDPAERTPAQELAQRVVQRAQQQGLIVQRIGTYDNVIRLLPPLTISESLLEDALEVLTESLLAEVDSARVH
jgi:4-aminobutyrate aminotransferase/(S)-3-amino-2-methylpropionate transaminase